jgi:hypothetical protein
MSEIRMPYWHDRRSEMSEQVSADRQVWVDQPVGGAAVGLVLFAGIMMVMIGTFQVFEGLAAILADNYYVVTPEYAYSFDVTAWGWIHLVLGCLVAIAGFFVFSGQTWARVVGVIFVAVNAISQFVFLPYHPVWAVLMIVIDVFVIWALCVYGKRSYAML